MKRIKTLISIICIMTVSICTVVTTFANEEDIKNNDDDLSITVIDFCDALKDGKEWLQIKMSGTVDADHCVLEINVLTDEKDDVGKIILTFRDDSTEVISPETIYFKDAERIEKVSETDGLSEYYASIELVGYYAQCPEIKMNGVSAQCEILNDNEIVPVPMEYEDQPVHLVIYEMVEAIKMFFVQIIELMRRIGF